MLWCWIAGMLCLIKESIQLRQDNRKNTTQCANVVTSKHVQYSYCWTFWRLLVSFKCHFPSTCNLFFFLRGGGGKVVWIFTKIQSTKILVLTTLLAYLVPWQHKITNDKKNKVTPKTRHHHTTDGIVKGYLYAALGKCAVKLLF